MKAKVKATGEIIDVELVHDYNFGTFYYQCLGDDERTFEHHELDYIKADEHPIKKEIDWEQRRYEVAKETLPYALKQITDILSDPNTSREKFLKDMNEPQAAAKLAVGYANILIKELVK